MGESLLLSFSPVGQLFGCGSVAQTVLSRNTLGEPLTVHIGFSVGLMMAAYVAGGVSGKHDVMRLCTSSVNSSQISHKALPAVFDMDM